MSVETATVASGLVAVGGQPVPLLGVRVEAEIKDYGARVVLVQRYRNDEKQPIEAVYKFPLDEAAAVCGFEATIDDRRVVGQVEEREKAFEKFDEAIAAGHGAYLLDQERADVFTVSVGNVPPGKEPTSGECGPTWPRRPTRGCRGLRWARPSGWRQWIARGCFTEIGRVPAVGTEISHCRDDGKAQASRRRGPRDGGVSRT